MKRLINDPNTIVDEMLAGMAAAHPYLVRKLPGVHAMARADAPIQGKVGVVAGGGSGHEPFAAGYLGPGMLDAAVHGAIFTSPTPDQVYEAIKAADGGAGVLLVILNYTGDVMNFSMAAEMAEAEGIRVEQVIINDDVAVEDSTWTTGRRGIAGAMFYCKMVGAMAATGASLDEVKAVAEKTMTRLRSMAMAVTPCTNPAVGHPSFELPDDEVEIGMGIHGEPGTKRMKIGNCNAYVDTLLDTILADMPLAKDDEIAVLVNGSGSTPIMELYVCYNRVAQRLEEMGIKTVRNYVGNYMTSLDMMGFSITLFKLDAQLKELLLAPAASLAVFAE